MMARAYFPGRPGQRVGRIRVESHHIDPENNSDVSSDVAENARRGLEAFYQFFGDAEEEEEHFEGFTSDDVNRAEETVAAVGPAQECVRESPQKGHEKVLPAARPRPIKRSAENGCNGSSEENKPWRRTFVLPSRSARSSRIIIPKRRFGEDSDSDSKPKAPRVPAIKRVLPEPPKEQKDPKERIRKDISEYAESMARGAKKSVAAACEAETTPEAASPDTGQDRVTAKIERILRSPWEGRLRPEGGHKLGLDDERRNTQRSSRNILRKARLQLNKRTLMKLRQPSSVRKLSEQLEKDQERIVAPIHLRHFPTIGLQPIDLYSTHPPSTTPNLMPLAVSVSSSRNDSKVLPAKSPDIPRSSPGVPSAGSELVSVESSVTEDSSLLSATRTQSGSACAIGPWALLTSPGASRPRQGVEPNNKEEKDEDSDSVEHQHGPRIKHVCRRAAVVLGYPRAIFPSAVTVPTKRKKRIPATEKRVGNEKQFKKPRTRRCKVCEGCLAEECKKCVFCLDRRKFGGRDVLRKACVLRRCQDIMRMANPVPAASSKTASSARQRRVKSAGNCKEPRDGQHDNSGRDCAIGKSKPQTPCELTRPNEANKGKTQLGLADRVFIPRPSKPKEKDDGTTTWPSPRPLHSNAKPEASCAVRLAAHFWEDYDPDDIWNGGMGLISSMPFVPRTLCYLCGSGGKHELTYCVLCCEPFHAFCLQDDERPAEGDVANWCCTRCRYCTVCGLPDGLLQCKKCRKCYHRNCLGRNYPSRPSRKKKIWICHGCASCKSCGANTPGITAGARWMHDYSMCIECEKLRKKGNYCPICQKCYRDEDYISKMVQCWKCQAWIHAKCDNITDELYRSLIYLPDSVVYTCRCCTSEESPDWHMSVRDALQSDLRLLLSIVEDAKSKLDNCSKVESEVVKNNKLESKVTGSEVIDIDKLVTEVVRGDILETDVMKNEIESINCTVSLHNGGEIVAEEPISLKSIRDKLDLGLYKLVSEFCVDVEKVIAICVSNKGNINEIQRLFSQKLKQVFPWFKNSLRQKVKEKPISKEYVPVLDEPRVPPNPDHCYAYYRPAVKPMQPKQPDAFRSYFECQSISNVREISRDTRKCVLCCEIGDDEPQDKGRLLYCGQDDWIHLNCALWSAEVYEEIDGSLQYVHDAISRGKKMKCERCGNSGATVGCCDKGCPLNFHFSCARMEKAVFFDDKKVFCSEHAKQGQQERKVVEGKDFAVLHTVYIDLGYVTPKWVKKSWQNGLQPSVVRFMAGSSTVEELGEVTELSDFPGFLIPVGFRCSRIYWSTENPMQRVEYVCRTLRESPADREVLVPIENKTIAHGVEDHRDFTLKGQPERPKSGSSLDKSVPHWPKHDEPRNGYRVRAIMNGYGLKDVDRVRGGGNPGELAESGVNIVARVRKIDPFRCPKCKRVYRTKESFTRHFQSCDFEVDSSSTDEDEDDIQITYASMNSNGVLLETPETSEPEDVRTVHMDDLGPIPIAGTFEVLPLEEPFVPPPIRKIVAPAKKKNNIAPRLARSPKRILPKTADCHIPQPEAHHRYPSMQQQQQHHSETRYLQIPNDTMMVQGNGPMASGAFHQQMHNEFTRQASVSYMGGFDLNHAMVPSMSPYMPVAPVMAVNNYVVPMPCVPVMQCVVTQPQHCFQSPMAMPGGVHYPMIQTHIPPSFPPLSHFPPPPPPPPLQPPSSLPFTNMEMPYSVPEHGYYAGCSSQSSSAGLFDVIKKANEQMSALTSPGMTVNDVAPIFHDASPNIHNSAYYHNYHETTVTHHNNIPHIAFEIASADGFYVKSNNINEAWRTVAERVQDARAAACLQPMPVDSVQGLSMLGVTHKAVQYLLKQMPGAKTCRKFHFRFHESDAVDRIPENASGCARSETFNERKEYDIFNFLASPHRKPPDFIPVPDEEEMQHKSSRRATSMDLPMAMRFRHIRKTAHEAVGVYRSPIHGRGLFCKRNIDAGEMVIEYAGEVIRSVLTDKREKFYESKGIGCYMFRINDNEVVDATMHGNAARFINHSCEPNCFSKVINVDNKKHIVIFALRRILRGEELTYDYKFPIEEVKIPCSCGSRKCRRYLN